MKKSPEILTRSSHRTYTSDVLVVGNYCHDILIGSASKSDETTTHEVLGGSAAYISSILNALELNYAVVAKVGTDFRYTDQVEFKPNISTERPTTSFIDDYRTGERSSVLQARCESIFPSDIKEVSKIGLGCPVASELPPETLLEIRKRVNVLICDIQGFIRRTDHLGNIEHCPLVDSDLIEILGCVDYLKVSENELPYVDVTDVCRRTNLLITQDAKGCRVLEGGREYHVPSYPVTEVDPTGAGDSFVAGFAYGVAKGLDTLRSVQIGNYCGALAVTQVGIPNLRGLERGLQIPRGCPNESFLFGLR